MYLYIHFRLLFLYNYIFSLLNFTYTYSHTLSFSLFSIYMLYSPPSSPLFLRETSLLRESSTIGEENTLRESPVNISVTPLSSRDNNRSVKSLSISQRLSERLSKSTSRGSTLRKSSALGYIFSFNNIFFIFLKYLSLHRLFLFYYVSICMFSL